jgi:hypothetical protein
VRKHPEWAVEFGVDLAPAAGGGGWDAPCGRREQGACPLPAASRGCGSVPTDRPTVTIPFVSVRLACV